MHHGPHGPLLTRRWLAMWLVLSADCGSRTAPRTSDAALADAVDVADVVNTGTDALTDAGLAPLCGDAACAPGTICVRDRCAGCCDLPPTCLPIPSGCTGALACGCLASDPCGGCTTCLSIGVDGIHCGDCRCACGAAWTPIATPDGPRPLSTLRVGDLVYSMDHGAITAVPIARVNHVAVTHHALVRALLANGGVVEMSGRHPTADGRTFADLAPGDGLGDATVVALETEAYDEPFTYDILPASDTGAYVVDGALVGSTLRGAMLARCAPPTP